MFQRFGFCGGLSFGGFAFRAENFFRFFARFEGSRRRIRRRKSVEFIRRAAAFFLDFEMIRAGERRVVIQRPVSAPFRRRGKIVCAGQIVRREQVFFRRARVFNLHARARFF